VGAKAPRAHTHFLGRPIHHDRYALDIGRPFAIGSPLGVADIVAELNAFTANLTLGHRSHLRDKKSADQLGIDCIATGT